MRFSRRARVGATIIAVCGWAFLANVLDLFSVTSTSMTPAIRDHDYVLVFTPGQILRKLWTPKRGSVVVIAPDASDGESTTRDLYVKRIVAGPGDLVCIREGTLILNHAASPEPYVFYGSHAAKSKDSWPLEAVHRGNVRIPNQSYFVLGDNRAGSLDSRVWGPLARRRIVGVVIVTLHTSWLRRSTALPS